MSTPKRPGDQIWQIYPGKSANEPSHYQTSMITLQISVLHSQIYPGKSDDRPPQANLPGRRGELFSFQIYLGKTYR